MGQYRRFYRHKRNSFAGAWPPKAWPTSCYLVVDGIDGKAHYVALPARTALAQYPIGAVVEARASAEVRSSRLMAMFQLPLTERAAKYRAGESPKERRNMAMKLLGEA